MQPVPVALIAPDDWIIYDDATYMPIVDDVSRSLDAARKAFDRKDYAMAAAHMRAVADELKLQADRASDHYKALEKSDEALLLADKKDAHDNLKRMNAIASKASSAADAIDRGKLMSKAGLDKVIDQAARTDMERRWVVTAVAIWHPVTDEPQSHFTEAVADYAKRDYKAAAAAIRKGVSYMRLEAARATGDARRELQRSILQLEKLGDSVAKGGVEDHKIVARAFGRANHALARKHRASAAQTWAQGDFVEVGCELKTAAQGLRSAAGWVREEASAGASATVAATHAMGDKLVGGTAWTRDEVSKGFESLGNGINALGQKMGATKHAAAMDVGV